MLGAMSALVTDLFNDISHAITPDAVDEDRLSIEIIDNFPNSDNGTSSSSTIIASLKVEGSICTIWYDYEYFDDVYYTDFMGMDVIDLIDPDSTDKIKQRLKTSKEVHDAYVAKIS